MVKTPAIVAKPHRVGPQFDDEVMHLRRICRAKDGFEQLRPKAQAEETERNQDTPLRTSGKCLCGTNDGVFYRLREL